MDPKFFAQLARDDREFLGRVLKAVPKDKGDFKPYEGSLTLAQQIAHIGKTTDWFREGLFGSGFDMDFERLMKEMLEPVTLDEAFAILNQSFDAYISRIESSTPEELTAILPPNDIIGELPRWRGLLGNTDHIAHHRGSISVYIRGLGLTPPVPYMD